MKKVKCKYLLGIMTVCFPYIIESQTVNTFSDNEKLSYVAAYSLGFIYTEVGDVYIKLEKTNEKSAEYHVIGEGKTRKFYDKVFRVRDLYEARFETAPTFRSLYFHRDVDEGGYLIFNSYTFDWNKKLLTGTMQHRKREVKPYSFSLSDNKNYSDVLTCFYNFRNQDFTNLKKGNFYSFLFVLDNELFSIKCVFKGKEVRKSKKLKKQINCLKFDFEAITGETFKGDEVIQVWMSDDQNHIPVEFEFPIRIGRMRAYLQDYEFLKYPLNFVEKGNVFPQTEIKSKN